MLGNRTPRGLTLGLAFTFASAAFAQTDIARWNFTQDEGAPYNNPSATTQLTTAYAKSLGMDNNYVGNSSAQCEVDFTTGDPNPLTNDEAWRVKGQDGWANQAPQYTQGAEFDVSTVGFTKIDFSFDWYASSTGIAYLQLQYNTNVNDANGWVNYQGAYNGNQSTVADSAGDTILFAKSSGWNTKGTNATTNLVDFSGIAGVADDANFGIRLVSVYKPGTTNYYVAKGGTSNSFGYWGFDQVAFQGTAAAVPEPAPVCVLAIGGLGLLLRDRKRN